MVLATVLFAVSPHFKAPNAFFAAAACGRLVQGLADALVCVAIPSLVAIEWPQHNESYQGYLNGGMGIGLTLGPLLNACVYDHLGYEKTFLAYAGFIAFFGLGSTLFMPNRLNQLIED